MTTNRQRGLTRVGILLLAVLASFGCGSGGKKTYPVTGRVIFREDGLPMTGGLVEFESLVDAKVGARGDIQPDGTFRLSTFTAGDGAVEGPHRAIVVPPATDPDRPAPKIIDARFRYYDKSELKYTVERGSNHFVIEVQHPK